MTFVEKEPVRDNLHEYLENEDETEELEPKRQSQPSPQTQIKYLQTQLETARNLLHEKQEKIFELETALKESSFVNADELPVIKPPKNYSTEQWFNLVSNPYWIILQ